MGRQRSSGAPTPAEVLGVPALPPASATAAVNRLRAAVRRGERAVTPPPVQVLDGLFGMLDHRVLVALCQAGVPEALTGPTDVAALAAAVGADEARLERMVRFAATRGWLRIDRRGRVRPNQVTAFLRADHPGGWRAWVDFAGGPEVTDAVAGLGLTAATAHPFERANGATFFEWMVEHPVRWRAFDDAMAAGARMHALVLAAALDWSQDRTVCDVGGGTGALLAALLALEPGLEGTVLDLPEVVGRAVEHPRLRHVGGDAFAAVPAGFDTYLLVNVVHDWGDADATRLLERVAEAAPAAARVVVVDADRPVVPRPDPAVAADVLMAALTEGGRERDATEISVLAGQAGLRLERTVPLASGDVAHVLRPVGRGR